MTGFLLGPSVLQSVSVGMHVEPVVLQQPGHRLRNSGVGPYVQTGVDIAGGDAAGSGRARRTADGQPWMRSAGGRASLRSIRAAAAMPDDSKESPDSSIRPSARSSGGSAPATRGPFVGRAGAVCNARSRPEFVVGESGGAGDPGAGPGSLHGAEPAVVASQEGGNGPC